MIPISATATPSKLCKTSLFIITSMWSIAAICFLSKDDKFIMPEIELITKSTLEGGNMLLR